MIKTNYYVIWRLAPGAGMFSNAFHILGHVLRATRSGMVPVVDMQNYLTYYNEPDEIFETRNAWEYYFEQPCQVSLEQAYGNDFFVCDGSFPDEIYNDVLNLGPIANRYLRPKINTTEYVDAFFAEHFFGNKVLGVHFRGQEMKTTDHHPTPPTIDQVVEKITFLVKFSGYTKIFLVTEEQSYLDAIKHVFGDMVVYTDAFRTYGVNAYKLLKYPRPLHNYNLGIDIMRDTYLLARADALLAGGNSGIANGSNVSLMAQVINELHYTHVTCIYNGVNNFKFKKIRACVESLKPKVKNVIGHKMYSHIRSIKNILNKV